MIIWQIDKLADALVNGRITENIKIRYYLALIFLQIVGTAIPAYLWGSKIDKLGLVSYILGAGVASYYVIRIFHINNGIDGENIIERLTILSFPAFLKSTLLYWALYFVFSIIYVLTENMVIFQVYAFLILPFYFWFGFELIANSLKKQCRIKPFR